MNAPQKSTFLDPSVSWVPQLVSCLRRPYTLQHARADMVAGLTVAIVAWPLSMAIAIAAGLPPERGLFTAIIGGFVAALFSGGRFQISGPEGAFIALVAGALVQHGLDGVVLATFLAGILLMIGGVLGAGRYMRLLPPSVILGFTSGVSLIVLMTQIKELFGLTDFVPPSPQPGAMLEAFSATARAINPHAAFLSAFTILSIVILRRYKPAWPHMLIAVLAATAYATLSDLPVAMVATRCGALSCTLPAPVLPHISLAHLQAVFPTAVAFALLGGVESLLCGVMAERATGQPHRPRCELIAQGLANMGAACFGGLCVTGTIARTMTNIRAGAHSPLAALWHAVFLLLFLVFLGPCAEVIPLAALAGMLSVVSYHMFQPAAVVATLRGPKRPAVVFAATFFCILLYDLLTAIAVGAILDYALSRRMCTVTA